MICQVTEGVNRKGQEEDKGNPQNTGEGMSRDGSHVAGWESVQSKLR